MEQTERERDVASNVAGGTLKTDERENNPCKLKQKEREIGGKERGGERVEARELACNSRRIRRKAAAGRIAQHSLPATGGSASAEPFRVPPSPHPGNAVDSGTDVRFLMYYFGNELAVFNLMNRDGNNKQGRRRNLMQRQKMDSYGNSHALYAYLHKCVCVCL